MRDDQIILVTGGSGFIGSAVISELNHRGYENIVVVDELDHSEKWKNLIGKRFIELVPKDSAFQWIKERENEITAMIHLGACSSTVETDANYLHRNNTLFSQSLYEIAEKNGARFVYASSAATYGDGSLGFEDNEDQLNSLRPLNMYGLSKLWFDVWLRREASFKNAAGLKYFNIFGPNEYHKGRMASALYHMFPHAKREGVVKLFRSSEPEKYPDGGQKRDFLYVKDAARITCDILENECEGIFNVGMGRATTWNEVANTLFKSLKIDGKIEYIPMPEDLLGKYQNYSCASMDKTKEALSKSWKEPYSIEKAVQDYVCNYLLPEKNL